MEHIIYEINNISKYEFGISDTKDEEIPEFLSIDDIESIKDLPERYDEDKAIMIENETPKFIENIFNNNRINFEDKEQFVRRFLCYYYQSISFRKLTEGWMILFTNSKYMGIFEKRSELLLVTDILDKSSGLPMEVSYYDEPLLEGIHPNDYPERVDEYSKNVDNINPIIMNIIQDYYPLYEAKLKFITKFVITYCQSSGFRELTKNWVFLFIDRLYYGVYETSSDAYNFAHNNNFSYKNGNNLIIWPIKPEINYEYKEYENTSSTSEGNIIYANDETLVDENGDKLKSIQYNSFILNCAIGNEEQHIKNNITDQEEYIVDTGCTVTRGCGELYYNYLTYKYDEYPFNEHNEQIIDETLRKPNMNKLNKMIIGKEITIFEGSLNNKYERVKLFFNKEAKFIINSKVCIPLTVLSMPKITQTVQLKKTNMIDTLRIKLPIFNSTNQIKRQMNDKKLLGMDIFLQCNPVITKVADKIFVLVVSESKEDDFDNILISDFKHKVYVMDLGLVLYLYESLINPFNKTNNIFCLSDKQLYYEHSNNEYYINQYKTKKRLNILILLDKNFSNNKIEEYIELNEDIHGYLYKEEISPYLLKLYIKPNVTLHKLEHISKTKINDIELSFDSYCKDRFDEYNKLIEFKLGQFIINKQHF